MAIFSKKPILLILASSLVLGLITRCSPIAPSLFKTPRPFNDAGAGQIPPKGANVGGGEIQTKFLMQGKIADSVPASSHRFEASSDVNAEAFEAITSRVEARLSLRGSAPKHVEATLILSEGSVLSHPDAIPQLLLEQVDVLEWRLKFISAQNPEESQALSEVTSQVSKIVLTFDTDASFNVVLQ